MTTAKKQFPAKKGRLARKKSAPEQPSAAPVFIPEKHPGGRPTLYREEYASIARFICSRREATDADLAECFGVAESTINLWKKVYSEFSESIKTGKDDTDARVEAALVHRALGYSHPDIDIKVIKGKIVMTDLVKHYPPSEVAAIFWLKNRKPDQWRDKQVHEHTGLSWEELVAAAARPADAPAPIPVSSDSSQQK